MQDMQSKTQEDAGRERLTGTECGGLTEQQTRKQWVMHVNQRKVQLLTEIQNIASFFPTSTNADICSAPHRHEQDPGAADLFQTTQVPARVRSCTENKKSCFAVECTCGEANDIKAGEVVLKCKNN